MKFKQYPDYKKSNIEWISYIPQHWKTCAIKHSLSSIKDGTHGSFERVAEGIPLLSAKNIGSKGELILNDDESLISKEDYFEINKNGYLKLGDLLLTIVGTVGRAAIFDHTEPVAFQRSVAVLRPDHETCVSYLFYLTQSQYFQESLAAAIKKSAQGGVYLGDLACFTGMYPPKKEQQSIAAFLDRETVYIDTLLVKKQRQIELLQEKRATLISHVVTKGLNPDAKMKDSGIEWLGEIPEHWKIVPLKFTLKSIGGAVKTGPFGSQLLSSEMASGTVKVYNQRNVIDHDFFSGDNYITESKYQDLRGFTILSGDILVTTRGTIGRCALFPDSAELGILHPCLMRIQINRNILLPSYLSLLIQDGDIVLRQLQIMSNATTIDVIYSESLKSVQLPIPPTYEQEQILRFIEKTIIENECLLAKIQDSITRLNEYRTALISAAVTGKIDVRKEVA